MADKKASVYRITESGIYCSIDKSRENFGDLISVHTLCQFQVIFSFQVDLFQEAGCLALVSGCFEVSF